MRTVRSRFAIIGLALVVVALGLFGNVAAKYVTSLEFSGNVTFDLNLAASFTLTESKANRISTGEYVLDKNERVTENSYYVMPGVDIPKDPYVTVTGKTNIDSYLYFEVHSHSFPASVSIDYSEEWILLADVEGNNGGAVYVYKGNTGSPLLLNSSNCPTAPIQIIKGDLLTVSHGYDDGEFIIDFYAYLLQAVNNDPAETFNEHKPTP